MVIFRGKKIDVQTGIFKRLFFEIAVENSLNSENDDSPIMSVCLSVRIKQGSATGLCIVP